MGIDVYSRQGDITIGGIFPIFTWKVPPENTFQEMPVTEMCDIFQIREYRWLHAFIFVIEEVNKMPTILSNITLGYGLRDSCDDATRALEGTMWLMTGKGGIIPNYRCHTGNPLSAVIGDSSSRISITMARVLGLNRYPQISYYSSVALLNDKVQFPSFLRTIPSDEYQSIGIACLVVHYGWNWVGILAEETDYGQMGGIALKNELQMVGVCISFFENVPTVATENRIKSIVETVKSSSAAGVILFSIADSLFPLMDRFSKYNDFGKVFIATDGWISSPMFFQKDYFSILDGTIGFMVRRGEMPGFKEYLFALHPSSHLDYPYANIFWESVFNCKWASPNGEQMEYNMHNTDYTNCTGNEDLHNANIAFFDFSSLRITYNVYNSVYSIIQAMHDLQICVPGEGPFTNGTCADIYTFKSWQLLHYLRNVHFLNNAGEEVFFDIKGNAPAIYDIINWQNSTSGLLQSKIVGRFLSSSQKPKELTLYDNSIKYNKGQTQVPWSICSESCPPGYRKAPRKGQPVCCFDCVLCSEGEISNHSDSTFCLQCLEDHWPNAKQTVCIPKTVEFLSYQETLGTALAAIIVMCSFLPCGVLLLFLKYRDTPIVKANNRELSYNLLLALSLCFLCSLIFIGQPNQTTCLLRQVAFGIVFVLCVSCVLAKTIMVVIAFKATNPNSKLRMWVGSKLSKSIVVVCTSVQLLVCISWLCSCPPFPQNNMMSQKGVIIIECNEGSQVFFWSVLGYMGCLAFLCFIVAFFARNLPDSFNEAKFITFSMLVFVSVWLAFIPAYLTSKGRYMVMMEVIAILFSSLGLLFCIFFPKCYIIMLRPEINTKDYLTGKANLKTVK
ncbi:extracellular calcium-sensing receptor-like [Protopterus annectens]|uniref:extracellular calcium-sensing receptor-like n=1 Tax=Protopterus annectens TaxID=7888 RepID=UPI001CFBF25C|nr:extracellular calcium-sensing receptor-like [Protopterus annectens]